MHGNNGSMDGDSAAAMRYTEARLSKISGELLKDIDKNTIEWAPNFDDTLYEPIVLPAKYPNLLVNGAKGISAGYATEIPPHNLGEVIDATIKRIDSPNCRLESILEIIKGPDFPTGGIVEGKKEITECLTKGKGRVIVRSKYEIIEEKNRKQVIFHEIPFEVNKALLVKKISDIIYDKKIDGMIEVRDESDREEKVRIALDLKKDANVDNILNYLFKNTDLQINYNYNMVAIVNKRPMVVGVVEILDAYIKHQKEVITRRTEFDLEHAKARMHIVEGLIKAISILDEVIKVIRSSKNKQDSINNLVKEFNFTNEQAEAIVNLQLYRLTNTDISVLEEEFNNLKKIIKALELILSEEENLKAVMKDELRKIKKEYATDRITEIKDEITEIKIDTESMIPKEDCIVVVTRDGYIKRTSYRSYSAVSSDMPALKDSDYIIGMYELNTMDTLLMFTNKGNYIYIPVYDLPDLKWKELGKHISNIINMNAENIIASIPVTNFDKDEYITIFTKNGMVKKTKLSEFKVTRYSKAMTAIKLKDDDEVVSVTNSSGIDVFITTRNGFGLRYSSLEISPIGLKASGVKAISLKDDIVVSADIFTDMEYITFITDKNTVKRVKLSEFEKNSRARKGVRVIRDVKTNPHHILKSFVILPKKEIALISKEVVIIKNTDIVIADRNSVGRDLSMPIFDAYLVSKLEKVDTPVEEKKEEVSLENIDKKILTIDDFLDDFKI